jgi:hypothetical protein
MAATSFLAVPDRQHPFTAGHEPLPEVQKTTPLKPLSPSAGRKTNFGNITSVNKLLNPQKLACLLLPVVRLCCSDLGIATTTSTLSPA